MHISDVIERRNNTSKIKALSFNAIASFEDERNVIIRISQVEIYFLNEIHELIPLKFRMHSVSAA